MEILKNDWSSYLSREFEKTYYKKLRDLLKTEYQVKVIYPDMYDIFNALHLTSYENVKVVILGQDPYHGPNQAHGLSFSVKQGINPPPSLVNIFKELENDLGCYIPDNGDLTKWAEQGVLMLNAVLTVQKGEPNSHRGIGWETFTNQVITVLNQRKQPVVFILWGKNAQEKEQLISENHHYIIKSPHPSPFSANRGFFGSKPFSKTNSFLESIGNKKIDWQIENIR